jgi:uncharacterized protein
MKIGQVMGLGMLVLAGFTGTAAADPSFDCAKAGMADEKAICASPELSKLDSLVAAAYAGYQPDFQTKGSVARLLLRDRQSCGGDTACIATAQLNALDTYGGEAPWADEMVNGLIAQRARAAATQAGFSTSPPQKPAECVRTRIKEATTRFGNPLAGSGSDTGAYVLYENGGYINAYDRDKNFDGIAPGQVAVLCLVSVPHDCPAGDARGRIYYTLDVATGGTWTSSDSEHSCGGA